MDAQRNARMPLAFLINQMHAPPRHLRSSSYESSFHCDHALVHDKHAARAKWTAALIDAPILIHRRPMCFFGSELTPSVRLASDSLRTRIPQMRCLFSPECKCGGALGRARHIATTVRACGVRYVHARGRSSSGFPGSRCSGLLRSVKLSIYRRRHAALDASRELEPTVDIVCEHGGPHLRPHSSRASNAPASERDAHRRPAIIRGLARPHAERPPPARSPTCNALPPTAAVSSPDPPRRPIIHLWLQSHALTRPGTRERLRRRQTSLPCTRHAVHPALRARTRTGRSPRPALRTAMCRAPRPRRSFGVLRRRSVRQAYVQSAGCDCRLLSVGCETRGGCEPPAGSFHGRAGSSTHITSLRCGILYAPAHPTRTRPRTTCCDDVWRPASAPCCALGLAGEPPSPARRAPLAVRRHASGSCSHTRCQGALGPRSAQGGRPGCAGPPAFGLRFSGTLSRVEGAGPVFFCLLLRRAWPLARRLGARGRGGEIGSSQGRRSASRALGPRSRGRSAGSVRAGRWGVYGARCDLRAWSERDGLLCARVRCGGRVQRLCVSRAIWVRRRGVPPFVRCITHFTSLHVSQHPHRFLVTNL
ncbi:hypothetical protein OBBRIDRAFT_520485 [Obba rivulosa]|uniref:Uncharacterized protein n=1 Tax=Obba rivulosa TaxID=1052685 RepID=A0A8E2AV78_9APHY|nr:hypothetical protein OBBRIDRAFT_520485 [Obba rivulosa]